MWFAHSPLFFSCVWTTHFAFCTQRCGKISRLFYTMAKERNLRAFASFVYTAIRRKSTVPESYTQSYQQAVDNLWESTVEIVEWLKKTDSIPAAAPKGAPVFQDPPASDGFFRQFFRQKNSCDPVSFFALGT